MNSSRNSLNESSANFVEGPPNAKKPRMSTISGGNEEGFLKAEIQRLKSELANLEESVKKKDQIIIKQIMDMSKFKGENSVKDWEISTLKETEAELRLNIKDLKETIRMHGDNINDEMENKQIKEMEEQLHQKNTELKALEEKNAQMEKTINNLLEKNSAANQKEEAAQKIVEEQKKKIEDLEVQLLNTKHNGNQLQTRISELENVENKLAEVTADFNDLVEKHSALNLKEEEAQKSVEEQQKKIKDLKSQVSNAKIQEDLLRTENEDLKKTIQNHEDKEEKLEWSKDEKNALEEQIAKMVESNNNLLDKNEVLKQKEEAAHEKIEEQKKKIKDLEEQIPNLSVKHVSLNDIFDGKKIIWNDKVSLTVVNVEKMSLGRDGWKIYSDDGTVMPMQILERYDANFKYNLGRDLICKDIHFMYLKHILNLVYSSSLKSLRLYDSQIRHQEFFQLVSSKTITDFCFVRSSVFRDSKPVNIDEILKELPNVETFKCVLGDSKIALTKEVLGNLAKLPPFSKLRNFELEIKVEEFDVEAFCKFIKKHPTVALVFQFYNSEKPIIDGLKKETKKAIAELQKNYQLSVKFMGSPSKA